MLPPIIRITESCHAQIMDGSIVPLLAVTPRQSPSVIIGDDHPACTKSAGQLTIISGADLPFPNTEPGGLIERFLWQFRNALLAQPAPAPETVSWICFAPDTYGAEPRIERSDDGRAFEMHTLPSPQVPIPSGHHLQGEVASNFFLPFPDAYRSDAIRRGVRRAYLQHRRLGEPLMLHAHTPGVIGFHLRQSADLGRKRGTRLPLVATHSVTYRSLLEAHVITLIHSLRARRLTSLRSIAQESGLLDQIFPQLREAPEVREGIEKTLYELGRVIDHWYVAPRNPSQHGNVRWGRCLLYLADKLGKYSHHRLQGSLAIAKALTAARKTVSQIVGVPLDHMPESSTDIMGLIEEAASETAGLLVDLYLRYFYSSCDRVLSIEGKNSTSDLERMRIPAEKIVEIDASGEIARQMGQVYHDISARRRIESLFQPRMSITNFHWGPPLPGYEHVQAEAKISDVHLGDGSGSSRASALLALRAHCARLGIR